MAGETIISQRNRQLALFLANGLPHFRIANSHAARAKFSGIGKQSAINLNSTGNDSSLSTAIVAAVCEDGLPLPSFGAKRPSDGPSSRFGETTLSSLERKIAADKVVSRLILALFWRYQVARLMPSSLHG